MRLSKDGHFILEGPHVPDNRARGRAGWRRVSGHDEFAELVSGDNELPEPALPASQALVTSSSGHRHHQPAPCVTSADVNSPPIATPCRTSLSQVVMKADPQMPQQKIKEQPVGWSSKAWSMYQTAYETLAPLRGGVGNVAATFGAMGLGPDNCVLKLAYILYVEDGEDDYPYMPRGCGDGFSFMLSGVKRVAVPASVFLAVLLGLVTTLGYQVIDVRA
eukprot:CAMPEP_0179136942 /NCGR_PEP_ID=MMETSP0796-20121207/65292_1 /TAXON_ID=73915 /ORGANISM="Pyrodinium bahamense, Strain pbaha01" /LENGTH=218 /DNA_ID=CAMNT_0020836073 /DNA_START=156 /DNA_END=809 /DNA_ORIENTATION=-